MIRIIKEVFLYGKYQYEIWMAQKSINRYERIIKKHEDKFERSLNKITQKRDRKVKPLKHFISNINKKIMQLEFRLQKLNEL